MKIAFVGVGSVVFGENVLTDFITHPSLKQEMTILIYGKKVLVQDNNYQVTKI